MTHIIPYAGSHDTRLGRESSWPQVPPGPIFCRPLMVKGVFCALTGREAFLFRGNATGSPVTPPRSKKAYTRGLSCIPVSLSFLGTPSTPAVRTHGTGQTSFPYHFPPPRLAHRRAGCGHGGTRHSNTSRSVHTRSVNPAAIAGVHGRHGVAEPVPLVDSGCRRGGDVLIQLIL